MLKFLTAALVAATIVSARPTAAAPPPLEVYGQLPNIEQVAISPDGRSIAMIWTNGEQRTVVVRSLTDGKVSQGVNAGQTKVRDLEWAGPDHLLIITSQTQDVFELLGGADEWFLATDFNLRSGKLRPLLQGGGAIINVIASTPEVRIVDGHPQVFVQGAALPAGSRRLTPTIFRLDLERGTTKPVEIGEAETRNWLLAQDGQAVARVDFDARAQRWSLLLRQSGAWREVRRLTGVSSGAALIGFAPDGASLIVRDPQSEEGNLRQVLADGRWGEVLPPSDALIFDAQRRQVGSYRLVGDKDEYRFLSPEDQKDWSEILAKLGGVRVELVSASDDRKVLVLRLDAPGDGPIYAIADRRSGQVMALGRAYEKLAPQSLSPVLPIHYKAADGLELTGYLTVPRGAQPKNLPLVVFPHGGPAVRDEPGFDWWAQAMASRGYAVLQVNYRGSDGFGATFLHAGYGQWGRKMQTDLSDGVRYLAGEGVVDPKRVCIVGASYGGYAALAGAVFDNSVYRCAVSVAGPSDMRRFVAWSKEQNGVSAQRYWTKFMGANDPQDPVLADISPALHADKVSAPVLLIHGKDDTVVPLEQSRMMADALKRAGKPVEFTTLDGTDHQLTRGDTRLATLKATIAFLEKNNPPN